MDNSRNYILDRLRSKRTSIEEFNYDQLQAPPLSMFLSPFDIQELNAIARSLRYSAKPEIRYQEIDKVMRRRGLVKFAAGTNRVVYRHPEFQDILIKVASDAVGLGDNPAEYRNQFLLKPFVAKCFEISPCGTVGIFERVNPITSREEFLSVADDVFELLNEWIIGKYIVADCGSKFFMNFGVRRGFGIVLLDYPYVYELDGNLLYCRKPDQMSQSGKCDGVIDYDDGYNFLKCTKCGATYKAKELEIKIKDKELIVEQKGEIKMKIKVSGGSNNVNTVVTTGEEFNNSNFKDTKKVTPKTTKAVEKEMVVVECEVAKEGEENKNKTIIEKAVIEEASKPINKSVNGVNTGIKSAVEISEDIKEKALAEKQEREEEIDTEDTPVMKINRAIRLINEAIGEIDLDSVKNDRINDIIMAIVNNVQSVSVFNSLMKGASYVYDEIEDEEEYKAMVMDENLIDLVKSSYNFKAQVKSYSVDENNNLIIKYDVNVGLAYERGMFEDPEDYTVALTDSDDSEYEIIINNEDFVPAVVGEENIENINEDNDGDDDTSDEPLEAYTGMSFYDGAVVDINTIFPSQKSKEIIVAVDSEGNYLTTDGNKIIAIDIIDDKNVNDSSIVSKEWLDSVNDILDSNGADKESVDNEEDAVEEKSDLPVGSVPNGVSMEEFLNNEESNKEE